MNNSVTTWWRHRSPAFRLSTAYVAIIMAISLIFSAALYELSADQLAQSLQRQFIRFRSIYGSDVLVPASPSQIEDELEAGKHRLALQLLYFNLIILGGGTALSYGLARRTMRPIEAALLAQTRFAADASHELRTPLTAMQTEIEVALRDPRLSPDEAKALLRSNLEEVVKLRSLADGLLRLARSEQSALPRERINVANCIREAVERMRPLAERRHIKLDNQATAGMVVEGDATALAELFVILLDNATKYSAEHTAVTISAQREGSGVAVSVADQGPGISAADLPHIFDRFYRADPARSAQNVPGHGLGLSLARQIVDLHRGSIQADSSLGHGSTFTVRLPSVSGRQMVS